MIIEEKTLEIAEDKEIHLKIKESGAPIWIIGTHGLGEHSGRHTYLFDLFASDFNICLYDLRGHGKSFGKRGNVGSFSDYFDDLEALLEFLKREYKVKRYVLFGHSMGALITAGFIQRYVKEDFYPERIILSAPPAVVGGPAGQFFKYAPDILLSNLVKLPSIPLAGLVDLDNLSHDPYVKEQYLEDALNCLKIHTHLVFELIKASKDIFSRPLRTKCSALCVSGSEDHIIGQKDLVYYFSTVDKGTMHKVFNGAYHELHNELAKYREPYFDYLKNYLRDLIYDAQ